MGPSQGGSWPFVDLALCHGHLSVALALLRRGARPKDVWRARADVRFHGSLCLKVAAEVLQLLPTPPDPEGFHDEERTPARTAFGDKFIGVFDNDHLDDYNSRDLPPAACENQLAPNGEDNVLSLVPPLPEYR